MAFSISDDKKVEILNDHYKDTCLRLAGYRKQRNRLVFYAAITIVITLFIQFAPTQMLRVVTFFVFRSSASEVLNSTDKVDNEANKDTTDNAENATNAANTDTTDDTLLNIIVRLMPALILMYLAITYKHYRIAMDEQFSYVKMLELELTSLYPDDSMFNRETSFSSAGSFSYSMWSSNMYSSQLRAGCIALICTYLIHLELDKLEIFVSLWGGLLSFYSMVLFVTEKPLTGANIKSLLTSGKEIG